MRYLDRDGETQEMACEGLLATCVQHEIDHLDGILFIDHISSLKRNMILRKLLKARKEKERDEAEGKPAAKLEGDGSRPHASSRRWHGSCGIDLPAQPGGEPMTPQQIELVQTSFKKVVPIAGTAADLFYDRLFEIAPEVRSMFPQDLTEQKKKLMGMLGTAVGSLHKLETILPAVQASASATRATA